MNYEDVRWEYSNSSSEDSYHDTSPSLTRQIFDQLQQAAAINLIIDFTRL